MNIYWLETLISEATCDVHSLPLEIKYAFTKQEFYFSDLRVILENCSGSFLSYEKCHSVSY